MTPNDSLERRIADHFAAEVPQRAPDRLLRAALDTIDTTRQRRVLVPVPWRYPNMNGFARLAVAAVAVIAIGALGLAILRPGTGPAVGAPPPPSPSPIVTPSPAPTPSPIVSPTPDPSAPPPLGGSFTSGIHGISIAYPTGWVAVPATKPWTKADGFNYQSPTMDVIHDAALEDHLFLAIASEPLGGKTGDAWVTDFLTNSDDGCGTGPTEPITVDGASGRMCDILAAFATGGRGYNVRIYTSEAWLSRYYDKAWLRSVLDTIRLHPQDAARPSPSA